jgi:hypothetical protein
MDFPSYPPHQPAQNASPGPQTGHHVPGPVAPAPRNSTVKIWLGIIYVMVLIIVVFVVYASQHNQLKTAQKQLADARSAQKAAGPSESSSLDSSKYQAVFLSNGQTYFGKITFINKDYLKLTDIFYLQNGTSSIQSGQTVSAGSASLVKLGCELHDPYDLMVINQNRVDFWENLQSQGQVAQAIKSFTASNPGGQKCPSS